MKKGKQQLLILSAAVILASTVLGTLAYFTDTTDVVVNTFTVGKVGITLTEESQNADGEDNVLGTAKGEGEAGFNYTLIPGLTYAKKPIVTVTNDSEDAYVRMKVTINNHADLLEIYGKTSLAETNLLNWNTLNWTCQGAPSLENDVATYEFRYNQKVVTPGALEPLFTTVTLPGGVDNDQLAALEGMEISVVAHAIQAAGFENADEAWAAFGAQEGK